MESTDSSSGSQQPQLPPGFRFHPTDEELVVHYLKRKAAAAPLPVSIIAEVDLYKFDPWELPERAIFGEQEWYFFTPRDRKYPNGARPNRAATSGYWKATGTDKSVLTAGGTQKVGVKKALVFYRGKPPKGIKTNWIMHEYRLITDNKSNILKPPAGCDFTYKKGSLSLRLDDWVLCRIYKKNNSTQRPVVDQDLNDVIMPADANTISIPVDQHINMYENMMMSDHHVDDDAMMMKSSTHHHQNLHMMAQRMLPNLYWNDEDDRNNPNSPTAAKISYLSSSENNSMTNNNSMANNNNILSHQTPSLQQQQQEQAMLQGNIGDGVFEQQAYQVSGMNWYT